MAHTVIETSNLYATRAAGARIYDCVCSADIDNGTIGHIEELATENGHIYTFVKGVADGYITVVACNPEWDYVYHCSADKNLDRFYIKANTPFRGYELKLNDEFGLTIDATTVATQGKVDIGKFATVNTDGKLVGADDTTTSAKFEMKILRKRTMGATLVTPAHTYGKSRVMYTYKVTKV